MANKTFVIGHVNPDTDSIAAAMGYAWLLRERDSVDAVAARAGALNPQSAWLLKQLKLEAPVLLAPDVGAGQVGGKQIRGELDAVEIRLDARRQFLDRRGLG